MVVCVTGAGSWAISHNAGTRRAWTQMSGMGGRRWSFLRAKELLRLRTEFYALVARGVSACFFRSCSLQDAAEPGPVSCLTVQGEISEPDSDRRLQVSPYSNISRDSRQESRASPPRTREALTNTPSKYSVSFALRTRVNTLDIKPSPPSSILPPVSDAPIFYPTEPHTAEKTKPATPPDPSPTHPIGAWLHIRRAAPNKHWPGSGPLPITSHKQGKVRICTR